MTPDEYSCNGICVTATTEIGVDVSGIAYPHPDCEKHGSPDPVETPECAECGRTASLQLSGGRYWCSRHARGVTP